MGKYSSIADISEILTDILVSGLSPELIQDSNAVMLCSPDDRGDAALGIWLYDVKESSEVRVNGMVDRGLREQAYPPAYLSLYYMITAYSSSDLKFRAAQEQRILGRAMQVLRDHNVIPAHTAGQGQSGLDVRIELLDLEVREQREIWNGGEQAYRTSLFYRVSPVELESEKKRQISRVRSIEIGIEERS